jgi:signal transduction histidine kinase
LIEAGYPSMKAVMPERLIHLKRLVAINRTITTSLDFEEALRLVAASGAELVGADSCLVLLRGQDDFLHIRAAQGVDPAAQARFVGSMEESVVDELRTFLGIEASRSIAATPIMSERTVQGILVVIRDAPLNPEETWLLSALADQAAISLGNARLHEKVISHEAQLKGETERSYKLAKELEELVHTVAHDLRAPLRAMTGCGELLLEEYREQFQTGRGREYLVRIASGARKMDGLIHDLLTYTHLSRAELHLESVDLEGAISEVLSELQAEIDSRQGHVRVESPHLTVLAHRNILVKILGNLISNAVKFVDPGRKPLVEIRSELLGQVVRVSVQDNGIGIREEYLERIFGVFERLNRAEEFTGTGIGLAIVRRGVERMGGRCGVESTSGQGSRFWIELRSA